MNKPGTSKAPIIIIIIILLAAAGVYFYMNSTPEGGGSSLITDGGMTSDASLAGSKVLILLNQISSLTIDTTLFKSAVYNSLVDHTVPIYEQNIGKPNPFLYTVRPRAK